MSPLFVFPGQGSQYIGMGEGLFEKFPDAVATADSVLGYSLRDLCLTDPRKQLNQTQWTQPALYSVLVLHYLDKTASGDVDVDYFAGHSLGEYAALYAGGAFDFETGLRMVAKRGELMANAPKGAMAAVLGLDLETVTRLLAGSALANVDVANINSATQIVISGDFEQIAAAERMFTDAGGQYRPLKVSAAFHSGLMKDVAGEYRDYLSSCDFSPLITPVIANLTARPYPQDNFREYLTDQIDHSVKWYESVSWALQQGCDEIEEIGPGFVLTRLASSIRQKPQAVQEEAAAATSDGNDLTEQTRHVFMFAGQGSQYRNMGRELYGAGLSFRKHFDSCSDIVLKNTGLSLVAQLYHPRSSEAFDDIRVTHPAIVCFEYALARMSIDEGIEPDALLGHSLGEYVAAIVGGSISLEDGLDLTIKQAELLFSNTPQGRMMVVLNPIELYSSSSALFEDVYFAGQNYDKSFVVTGERAAIERCSARLGDRSISHQVLPVSIAFHCPLIESVKREFIEYASRYRLKPARIPVHSSCTKLSDDLATPQHLWNAVAEPTDFLAAIGPLQDRDAIFLDLSPSGSLSLFLKYGFGNKLRHTFLVNQYGEDRSTVTRALEILRPAGKEGAHARLAV